jgi:hypothetical protein
LRRVSSCTACARFGAGAGVSAWASYGAEVLAAPECTGSTGVLGVGGGTTPDVEGVTPFVSVTK